MKFVAPPLFVHLNGQFVGQLTKINQEILSFQYDSTWLSQENSTPISLSLPIQEEILTGSNVTAVFENLIPDSETDRKKLATNVQASGSDTFSILEAIGKDCVGAFQILTEKLPKMNTTPNLRIEALDESSIEQILRDLPIKPLGISLDHNFRVSLAGTQKKTAFLYYADKWWKPLDSTATTHIFKIAIQHPTIDLSNSVENEFYCLKVLDLFNIPVNEASIEIFGETKVLVIKRFDRKWIEDRKLIRIHQEDLCQALSIKSNQKYQSDSGPRAQDILELLTGSTKYYEDTMTFIKSLILFQLLNAIDGHAKNYSIFHGKGGSFHLTPLYDVISIQPNIDSFQENQQKFKLALSVGKNKHYEADYIFGRHYFETGRKANVPKQLIQDSIDEIVDTLDNVFEKIESLLPNDFPLEIHESIMRGAKKRVHLLSE